MDTGKLIDILARDAGPAPQHAVERRLWPITLAGVALSLMVGLALLGLVPTELLMSWGWWAKFGYAVALVVVGAWLSTRLARPVQRLRGPTLALLGVLGAIGVLGLGYWMLSSPQMRLVELIGHSWKTCPRNIVLYSLPPMAGAFWAMRGLAPTRPRLAGAAVGLFAGALGAAAYAMSCSELAPSFVAVWYTLGIAASTAIGALLGPRVLRW